MAQILPEPIGLHPAEAPGASGPGAMGDTRGQARQGRPVRETRCRTPLIWYRRRLHCDRINIEHCKQIWIHPDG